MADSVSKWAAGSSCEYTNAAQNMGRILTLRVADGPVLSTTELYLLNPDLEINPILTSSTNSFQLIFNIATGAPLMSSMALNSYLCIGQTVGFNADARDRDLPFTAKDEPATLPRVDEIIIITELSPWCTIVKNPQGVTMNDICSTIWKE